ncbi:MAG: nucleotidyltransferase domain-containing protein [Bacteroidia bacterium]|nr:nucleotidyltransferase domain-containing protein [Bacteroidia bacterium]MDW8236717.1 nucleotidyltransferase domain-containing protein [Bacteroidia bacterium]
MSPPTSLPPVLESFLAPLCRKQGWQIYLFGSWARGEANPTDIDLAIVGSLSEAELAELREALEELPIPYRVDLISYHQAPPALQEAIQREGILWKPPSA